MSAHAHTLAVVLGVMTAVLGATASAGASEGVVTPGESIQAAIDECSPGDTVRIAPGEFRENLTITTDDITLQGAGAGRHGTVLMPSGSTSSPCADAPASAVQGICVHGAFPAESGGPAVRDVTIEDLTVDGFSGTGIYAFHAGGLRGRARPSPEQREEYGIAGLVVARASSSSETWRSTTASQGSMSGTRPTRRLWSLGNTRSGTGSGARGFGFLIRNCKPRPSAP